MVKEEFKEIRVRFAPSPTGLFHLGSARTTLFNYLFARRYGGKFILRIEDTDLERSKKEFEQNILDGIKWLGMQWDEGPEMDGRYGPYYQTQRGDIYEKYTKKLLQDNNAYYCFCTEEELDGQRQYQESRGLSPKYSGKCANLSKEEIEKNIKEGKPSVIRFRTPNKKIKFADLIRGDVEVDMELVGDFVIAKNERSPLFALAGLIDDYEMKISHVIRGEDHISNTPRQVAIQQALGFPQPHYAHLSMILGPDRSKMSKRHGATALTEYKEMGYLPEAMVNFMAFMGWNPGDEREIFSLKMLTNEFSIERCQKGGAIFNIARLDFINGFYIRGLSPKNLAEKCLPYFENKNLLQKVNNDSLGILQIQKPTEEFKIIETGEIVTSEWLEKIVVLEQQRIKKLSEVSETTDYFFKDKLIFEKELLKWKTYSDSEIKDSLKIAEKVLNSVKEGDWSKEKLQNQLMPEAEKTGDRGKILSPLRVALTGKKASPGPFEVAEVLGRGKALKRIKEAIEML